MYIHSILNVRLNIQSLYQKKCPSSSHAPIQKKTLQSQSDVVSGVFDMRERFFRKTIDGFLEFPKWILPVLAHYISPHKPGSLATAEVETPAEDGADLQSFSTFWWRVPCSWPYVGCMLFFFSKILEFWMMWDGFFPMILGDFGRILEDVGRIFDDC